MVNNNNYNNTVKYGGQLTWSILCISFVLRAPITALGPLADQIHNDIGISNGFVGFLSTLPLIAFAACSPFISRISNRFGIFSTMMGGLVLIAVGGVLRSYCGIAGLVAGTALLGMGIATGNVLVPSIIKLRFPDRIGMGTSLFVTGMGVFASVGAGVSYPLAVGLNLGWKTALVVWSGMALIAIICWIPQYRLDQEPKNQKGPIEKKQNSQDQIISKSKTFEKRRSVWKSPLAWYLTMYMGMQSFNFYTITAWLPSIVMGNGMSPEAAGYMALGFQLIGIPASFAVPILTSRIRNQNRIVWTTCVLYFIGFLCFLTSQPLPILLISLISLSVGAAASFGWIMTMIGLRSRDAEEAAKLAGMSQSVGYLMAATGPTLCGIFYDQTGNWIFTVTLISIITILMAVFGFLSAKPCKQ